ncbi:membrane protein [Propionigenium maris DSM 9537]|uniref:Membrane protein n=1 Tax=Propionigenium maris DSM 9537 TaxID=1123000 RepID=A0A9W6LPF4_9FUSO|nr:DMT family transporter [Propionigenium maris]GLI57949.1 membrane protein [Propionigenium maris DSM 9537]
MKKKRIYADLILLVVAFLWGTTFVGGKYALNYFTPLYIIAIRFIMAFFMMAVAFRKDFMTLTKRDIRGGAVVGTILFIAFATQLVALQYTEAGKQAFLAGTYVVMVPFISWRLKRKRPETSSFVGAFICFMGIGLLTLNESLTIGFGDGLTLFSSLFFAGHIISNGHYVDDIGPVKLTITQFGIVAVLSTLSALIFEPFPTRVASNGIFAVLYLGILCTGIAYFLQTIGQKYALSTHTAIILSLEAVFGSVLALFLLGEVFTFKMVLGCGSILAAILIIELKGSRKEEPSYEEQALDNTSEI